MDDWAAFLNARLGEDEVAAKALAGEAWTAYVRVGGEYNYGIVKAGGEVIAQCGTTHFDDGEARTAHIVLHDPNRTLREIAAKRAILAGYLKADDDLEDPWVTNALLTALGHHMAVWDDHPDYPAARKSLEEAYWTP